MVKNILFLGFILVLSYVAAEEVCLERLDYQSPTECTIPARRASKNDIDNLVIMCKIATGVFPFDPRGGEQRQPRRGSSYGEPRPYLELSSKGHKYRRNFMFQDCKKSLNYMSDQIFWVSEAVLPDGRPENLVGREFFVNDTARSNTCLGVVTRKNNETSFNCIRRDDFENQYPVPYGHEFMVIKYPEQYLFNVTEIKSSEETIENDHVDVGYFSYYNPSEFDQIIEVFLDTQHNIRYGGLENVGMSHTPYVITDGNYKVATKDFQDQFTGMQNQTIPYNITIPAYSSLTARIVGKKTISNAVFKGIKVDIYEKGILTNSTPTEIEGTRHSTFLSDFHLEEVQMHHTYEVMVLSYSTIYVVLMCIGVVLFAGLLVFAIRCAIKRYRRRPEVPYTVINEQAS
ncbi:integral component of membrane [Sergentomyia squamirostris]